LWCAVTASRIARQTAIERGRGRQRRDGRSRFRARGATGWSTVNVVEVNSSCSTEMKEMPTPSRRRAEIVPMLLM